MDLLKTPILTRPATSARALFLVRVVESAGATGLSLMARSADRQRKVRLPFAVNPLNTIKRRRSAFLIVNSLRAVFHHYQ